MKQQVESSIELRRHHTLSFGDGVRFGLGLAVSQIIIVIAAISLFMGGCGAALVTMLEAAGG